MTRDDIIRMAREAGWPGIYTKPLLSITMQEDDFLRFAELVAAAEREKVAQWMLQRSYATGHGDTTEDLLSELEWQVAERERKAILNILWDYAGRKDLSDSDESLLKHLVDLIRARGEA